MTTRSKKTADADEADDGEIKDATATIADLSTVVVALPNIASRAEEDRLDIRGVLGDCAAAFQDMQAVIQDYRSSPTTKTDPIVGEVARGTKPVLEPMPDVKLLPDWFRYKPDLANPSGPALHFEQCIDRVRDLSEKQVRGIITPAHSRQHRIMHARA